MNDNQRQVTQQEAECQLYLIQNPGYDSDWVGEASKILTNQSIDLSETDLVKFNALPNAKILWHTDMQKHIFWLWVVENKEQ